MSRPIRVLHVTAVPITGATLVAPIAQRQAQLGYHVEFACGAGDYFERLQELGFPVTQVGLVRNPANWHNLVAVDELSYLMRARRFDIVHTHTPVASLVGRLAATLARVPIIFYHMRGSLWESYHVSFLSQQTFTALEWFAARIFRTDHVFTLNQTDEMYLIQKHIITQRAVTCLHCGAGGVDTQRFDPERLSKNKPMLQAQFGIEPSNFVIGFIGRMVREKGIFDLVQAFRKLVQLVPHAKLIYVGGVLESEHDRSGFDLLKETVARDSLLSSHVIFTGFRQDIPELLSLMNVLVLPSYREGFGMALAEASAMGKPVIATNTLGAREAIVPGENGFIVPIADIDALYTAMFRLAMNPELEKSMGRAARKIAVEQFDETVIFERINQVYTEHLTRKGLPVPTFSKQALSNARSSFIQE